MKKIRLSIEESHNVWFGCLVDDRDHLVASAFGPSPKRVQSALSDYSRKVSGDLPSRGRPDLTHEMVRLFESTDASRAVVFNNNFVTGFQKSVYEDLDRIPRGKVTTYGLISKHLGSAPRAVGGAVSSNPWPLFVPCHRVVNWDLSIGNYGICGSLSQEGSDIKRRLLERERVRIREEKVDRRSLWDPSEKTD